MLPSTSLSQRNPAMNPVRTFTFIGGFACAIAALSASAVPQSIPGIYFQGPAAIEAEPALLLESGVATRTIELPAIAATTRMPQVKSQATEGSLRPGPREIGIVRDVPTD